MLTLLGLSRVSYTPLVSLSFRLCQPMCVWSADLDVNLRLHSCRLPRYVPAVRAGAAAAAAAAHKIGGEGKGTAHGHE